MKRALDVAIREFIATVWTKAFIIGLLIMPATITLAVVVGPRLFSSRGFEVKGEIAIIDPTGRVAPELRSILEPKATAERRNETLRDALSQAPAGVREMVEAASALAPSELRLVERPPDVDIQQEKAWLHAPEEEPRHLAVVVIHRDAVVPRQANAAYGSYDLYTPPNLDDRALGEIQRSVRDAIVSARTRALELDRSAIEAITRVARPRSTTVMKDTERQTVRSFNVLVPIGFAVLLFAGVITGGQALLTSTVEEKSSRVIEVLLSAVSPMELMAGKLLGQLAVSLLAMGLYIAMGLAMLSSFSLFGLLNPWLILYLIIFFLITYLVFGSLLMAIGSAVNELREAQSLMMPITLVLIVPYVLWMPISRDPNSTFSTVISFMPPINGFAMLLRMTSVSPPPWWQVWLSIAIGVASVFAALWFAAKVFRIGLLMYGKPPNFATLIRWARL